MKKQLFLILALCVAFSCNQTKKKGSSGGSSAVGSDGKTATGTGGKGASSGGAVSSGTDFSSLEALLGSLTGKGGGGGGGGGGEEPGEEAPPPPDPNSIGWSTKYSLDEKNPYLPYLNFQLYEVQKNYLNQASIVAGKSYSTDSDVFTCPGDSLIVGFRGLYDKAKGDRQMQPFCQFFEDGTGRPLKKQSCSLSKGYEAGLDANNDFTCAAGKFLSGFRSTWVAAKLDRGYEFECCELVNEDGKKMEFLQTVDSASNEKIRICERYPGSANTQGNHIRELLNFHCTGMIIDMQSGQNIPTATAIHHINAASFMNDARPQEGTTPLNDRIWTMECCAIGVNQPPPPPAQ